MFFENFSIHGFIYFDKKHLPFRPEKRQAIYFDVGRQTYGLTQYIDSHYDEISTMFRSRGFDFIFLPKILSLFKSEGFYRYICPDASPNEIRKLIGMIMSEHVTPSTVTTSYRTTQGLSMLLQYVMSPRSGISMSEEQWSYYMDYFPTGLICYAGEEYDTSDGYAFHYMPFDKFLNEDSSRHFQDIVNKYFQRFINKMQEIQSGESPVLGNISTRKEDSFGPLEKPTISKQSIGSYSIDEKRSGWGEETDSIQASVGFSLDEEKTSNRVEEAAAEVGPEYAEKTETEPPTFAEENFSTDVRDGLNNLQLLVNDLVNNKGISKMIISQYLGNILQPTRTLSHLHIRGTQIFLTDYNNMEIKMGPLPKAVFILFLRHSEGIRFSHLPDYREELLDIYSILTTETDKEKIRQSVEDVTDPLKNSINENASRIRRAFVSQIEPELAKHYFITGERGEAKKIDLSRDLVVWDSEIIRQNK